MVINTSNLRKMRRNKGLSQREVALRTNITLTNYSKIELGKSEPRLSTAILIARAIGESVELLFSVKDEKYERTRKKVQ